MRIHSSTGALGGCFHLLAIVSDAATNYAVPFWPPPSELPPLSGAFPTVWDAEPISPSKVQDPKVLDPKVLSSPPHRLSSVGRDRGLVAQAFESECVTLSSSQGL